MVKWKRNNVCFVCEKRAQGVQLHVDATPSYMMMPFCSQRMKKVIPEVRSPLSPTRCAVLTPCMVLLPGPEVTCALHCSTAGASRMNPMPLRVAG